uniref:ubiquitinyl hydrolase 1 n=1 Tax=Tetraodon nigroviridis TaxID=99883 RepID=H3C642_TETNG
QRAGRRRSGPPRGVPAEASSKKKQKDRANQESREAKRAVAVVDAVIAEVRKDVFVDWKQNVNEVTVRLRCGDGIQRKEDVSTSFTDKSCHVSFPDGRQWSCQLQEEIEASCSRVQYREKGGFLHLIMQKKIPFHTWPSLKLIEEPKVSRPQPRLQPQPPASPPHTEARRSSAKAARVGKGSSKSKPASTNSVHKTADGPSSKNRRTGKAEEAASGGKGDHSGSRAANGPEEQPKEEELRLGPFQEQTPGPAWDGSSHTSTAEVRKPPPPHPSTPAGRMGSDCEEEKQDQPKDEPCLESRQQEGWESLGPMVDLQYVKNDSYEKGTDLMVVNVYMKGLSRDTTRVLFREQHFTLFFQTSDGNFLRLHSDCGPNTHFKWQVKLRNLIEPEQCSYSFTPSRLDITLKKRHSQRWGGLEAPASQGAVGGAKVAVPSSPACMEKAQPDSSKHSLPAQQEPPRVQEEKAKVCKASARAEEGSLDPGAPSTVSEHVALTKAEPTFTMPKPTCMVQPMTHALPASKEPHEDEEEKKVCLPGFTGLVNLGNTCFMNSVIQSLSNTRELRDYFLDRAFEGEINCSNPLGTGGRLAIGFAVLLRALWKGTHHAFQPSKLKAIVASKASQFTGYAQHDAQEFMAFLLDGLHEDLNRIQNKPYTETVDSDGRLDEVVADEAWQRHKMRNDSFIVDLFQGQFKSKLVCPMCSKVSITFDPFLYLPVPLPQKQKVLSVYYFAKEPHKKPIKFSVSVSKENSHTAEVLESISRSVRVKAENLRLAEVGKNRFQRMFLPSHSLDTVSSSDMLFCFELLSKEMAKEKVVLLRVQQKLQVPNIPISKCAACLKPPTSEEDKLKRCTRCYRVGYCNQVCQRTHWPNHKSLCRPNTENVGLPFLVSVPESRLCYSRLSQLLEGYSRFSVDVFQPPFHSGRTSPDSRCAGDLPVLPAGCPEPGRPSDQALCSSSAGSADPEPDGPSLQPGQQQCAQASAPPAGEQFSSVSCCSFDPHSEKETSCEKTVRPEAAVTGYQQPSEVSSAHASQFFISLLDSNNKEQRLDEKEDALANLPEDATLELVWKNNERLKEYVLVSSKDLDYEEDPSSLSETARAGHFTLEQCLNLFTKPEVLAPEEAWYCPKCQQHREASKQLLLWRLPNVLIIQLKRFSFRSFIWRDKINDMVDFPIRNLDLSRFCIGMKDEMQQPVYDLYAVINHYGGMIGGHYTAYARLPSDKNSQRSDVGWRLFDDSTVTMVEESQVVTRYAYVLFYRRRNSPVERPAHFHRPGGAESPTAAGAAASQATSQSLFGTDRSPVGAATLGPEASSDVFGRPGECAAQSYSNMEEVD